MSLLLANGADINAVNNERDTALCVAALYGNEEIVKILLENGADIEAASLSFGGSSPLAKAVFDGHESTVRLLLENGANAHVKSTDDGWTLLHETVFFDRPDGIIKPLLNKRLDMEAMNHSGHTPLTVAVQTGCHAKVRFLLELGANPATVPLDIKKVVTGHMKWISTWH